MSLFSEESDQEFEDLVDSLESLNKKSEEELEAEIEKLNNKKSLTEEEKERKERLKWVKEGVISEEKEKPDPTIEIEESKVEVTSKPERGRLVSFWLNHFVSAELSLLASEVFFLVIGSVIGKLFWGLAFVSGFLFIWGQLLQEKNIAGKSDFIDKFLTVSVQALIPTAFYFLPVAFLEDHFWMFKTGLVCLGAYAGMGFLFYIIDGILRELGKLVGMSYEINLTKAFAMRIRETGAWNRSENKS